MLASSILPGSEARRCGRKGRQEILKHAPTTSLWNLQSVGIVRAGQTPTPNQEVAAAGVGPSAACVNRSSSLMIPILLAWCLWQSRISGLAAFADRPTARGCALGFFQAPSPRRSCRCQKGTASCIPSKADVLSQAISTTSCWL